MTMEELLKRIIIRIEKPQPDNIIGASDPVRIQEYQLLTDKERQERQI